MTPAIWADVQDDLAAAAAAVEQALARSRAMDGLPADLRLDREISFGKHLHDGFSAAEKGLQRVIQAVDGILPTGRSFHQDLIDRALRAQPGIREPLISAETAQGLRALARFRHAFRHTYATFAYDRAAPNIAVAAMAIPRLRAELTAFAASLGLAPPLGPAA